MTTTTPFLNLIVYNSISDGSSLSGAFIDNTTGSPSTSNVNRIDTYATNTSASVAYLMANPPPAYISAVNISGAYFEAINANVISYVTNMMMILKLNVTTSASPTLKINSLATLSLKKTNSIGNTVAIASGDLLGGKEYQFRYDGTQWMWVSATSQDQSGISGTPGNILNISTGSTIQDSTYGLGTATGVPLMTSGSIQQLNLGSGSTTNGSSILFDDRTWKSRMALPALGVISTGSTIVPLTVTGSLANSQEWKVISGSTMLAVNGGNFVFDYNTGNKIGTSASQKLVFYEGTPIIRPTVTGSSGGSDVVISLVQALANLGLIINGTT
jgi:hypothetical protein